MRPKPQRLQDTVSKASPVLPSLLAMTCAERSPQQGQAVWAFRGVPVAVLAGAKVVIGAL
jgi:hypothetical protein